MTRSRRGKSSRCWVLLGASPSSHGPSIERRLVMIAGGSGITPIMSILETVLRIEGGSRVTLIYGNRGWDDVIFRDRLATLSDEFGERLVVDHVLELPPRELVRGHGSSLSAMCSRNASRTLGRSRRWARALLRVRTDTHDGGGPRSSCNNAAWHANRIAEERFNSHEAHSGDVGSDKIELVVISKAGHDHGVQVEPGQTILEAALAAGIDMPFSCAMGGCGTCRVHRLPKAKSKWKSRTASTARSESGATCLPVSVAPLPRAKSKWREHDGYSASGDPR